MLQMLYLDRSYKLGYSAVPYTTGVLHYIMYLHPQTYQCLIHTGIQLRSIFHPTVL